MPFGSFWIKKKEEKKKVREEIPQKEKVRKKEESAPRSSPPDYDFSIRPGAVGYRISVLILGRSQQLIRSFLCSMNVNMNETVGEGGLAFYTEDHDTMSRMITVRKELDEFFYNRREEKEEQREPEPEGIQRYDFRISLAGRQSRCLEFSLTCVTEQDLSEHSVTLSDFDTLWVLEETPYLERQKGIGGLYQILGYPKGEEELPVKPVFFLISQFEYLERFRVFGQEITLSFSTKENLTGLIRESLNLTADDRLKYAHVLPVQIYGGLEFIGWDEAGNLLLDISESGFYQRYIPVGCQMPLIYTAQSCLKENQADFFKSSDGSTLLTSLWQSFHPYCENEALKAEQIGGDSGEKEF